MKWSENITLTQPLTGVHLVLADPARDAEARALEAEHAAYERGKRDGEKALSEQLLQQRSELLELQRGVLDSLQRIVPSLVREAGGAILELALESARKVVAGMPITAKSVEAVVQEAIGQLEDTSEIVVHLNAEDLALLRKHKTPTFEGLPDAGQLRFISSAEVTRGGCLVQTRFGILDARRETKFEQLRESACA
jgi:flagellar assembly protein FliH